MTDLKPALLDALKDVPAACATAFARQDPALPLIVAGDYQHRVLAQADGEPYQTEYIAAVDVYAAARDEMEALCAQADAALTALGLRRVFAQDLYDEIAYAWRKSMRYRCVMKGDRLYQ